LREDLGWLTARPIAHRGLHGLAEGTVENCPAAFAAAIEGGYGIECDLQLSADGEAMVFHDSTLDRLTEGTGRVAARTAADLKRVPFRTTGDRMQSLGEFLDQIGGRTVAVIELKSRAGEEGLLEARTAQCLRAYPHRAAVMSFNPRSMAWFAANAPDIARGQISMAYRDTASRKLPAWRRVALRHLLFNAISRPDFIAYDIRALPAPAVGLWRRLGRPVLTWTVRTEHDRAVAAIHADQIIFETFRP